MPRLQVSAETEEGFGELPGLQKMRRTHMLHLCTAVLWRMWEGSVQEVHSGGWGGGRPMVFGLLRAKLEFLKSLGCILWRYW
jgi:hypothetical protein